MCYIRDITPKSLFEVFPLEVIQTRLQMDLNIEQQKKRVSQWNPKPLPEFTQTYLIFVIFFTRAKFLENKIYTKKRQFFALNL